MLAARHKLPAVYPFRYFASAGGLISYGSDRRSEDIAPAFDAIKGRVEALYVCNDPLANADTRAVPSSTTSLVALAGRWV